MIIETTWLGRLLKVWIFDNNKRLLALLWCRRYDYNGIEAELAKCFTKRRICEEAIEEAIEYLRRHKRYNIRYSIFSTRTYLYNPSI